MTEWIFGVITLFTQLIEALAGFGATAVGLPFAALVMSTQDASAILNVNAVLVTSVITVIHFKKINWREYRRIVLLILPFLPVGFLIGSSLRDYDMILKMILGIFMLLIAGRYLLYTSIRKSAPKPMSMPAQYTALFLGAVIHGIFTTGGPLVTLYASNRMPEKSEFRATMCASWTTINLVVIAYRGLIAHMYTPALLHTLLISLPFLAVGILAGQWIHKKIRNDTFQKVVYWILLAGGALSLYTGFTALLKIL